jgi:hypothetical protein
MFFRAVQFVFFSAIMMASAYSQNYEKLQYRTYNDVQKFAVSVPIDWTEQKSEKFAIIFNSQSHDAYCSVKRTVDWSFGVITKKDYVKTVTENRQRLVDLLPLQFAGVSGKLLIVEKFPIGNHDGVIFVTTGEMNDQNVTSATYQILNAGALHTIGCYTLSENFGYYFPIFSNIGGSLTFAETSE